jgi:hypothetical protein
MLILLRIVAFLTILLALADMGFVTVEQVLKENKTTSSSSSSSSEAPPDKETSINSINMMFHRNLRPYGAPALLFCTGGMLYVLIRIASTQVDDVRAQSFVNDALSGRRQP